MSSSKQIAIKKFRANLAAIADAVENGQSFTVIRRSAPSFKVVPVDAETDEKWETVVDFTDKGKSKGAPIEDVLLALDELNQE